MTDEPKRDALDESEYYSLLRDYANAKKFSERIALLKELNAYIRKHFIPRRASSPEGGKG